LILGHCDRTLDRTIVLVEIKSSYSCPWQGLAGVGGSEAHALCGAVNETWARRWAPLPTLGLLAIADEVIGKDGDVPY
jgi:hypothetical protein